MNHNIIEAERWLAQAEHDVRAAEWDMKGGFNESTCFKMQQAAEKSLKAALLSAGKSGATSHSTLALAKDIITIDKTFEKIITACRELDKLYIPTRYPDALPSGTPHDYFTKSDAEKAISFGKQVIAAASAFIRNKENELLSSKEPMNPSKP